MSSRLSLKIYEPVMFRGPGEFDPTSRGVYSMARSLLMPSPSTIAGVLASLLVRPGFNSSGNWLNDYLQILGNIKIGIIGVKIKDSICFYNQIYDSLLKIRGIQKYSCDAKKLLEAKSNEEQRDLERKIRDIIHEYKCDIKRHRRIGVGLKTRDNGQKVANEEEGLIYTAEYVMYGDMSEAEIIADLYNFPQQIEIMVSLGGEGRVVELRITTRSPTILEEAGITVDKTDTFYVATPILFRTNDSIAIEDLKEIYGKVDLIGAGYSLAAGRRKPIYKAILPGSVLIFNKEIDVNRFLEGFGIGREIGYGKLIPI